MNAFRTIWLIYAIACTAQSNLETAMRGDDECSGDQQEACTLAMLQRRQDAAPESSLAVAPGEQEASATAIETSKVPEEAPKEAEGRHASAVSTAAKEAEETEDFMKPNNTEGGDHAYNSSDSMEGVPDVPWSNAWVDQKAKPLNSSEHSESSADHLSDSVSSVADLPEVPAAGNVTEPSELANDTTPEMSKPEVVEEVNPPEPMTVTLAPDSGPPAEPEELPSSSAEETPPSAEEAPPPPAEEGVQPPPAAEEMPPSAEEAPPAPAEEEIQPPPAAEESPPSAEEAPPPPAEEEIQPPPAAEETPPSAEEAPPLPAEEAVQPPPAEEEMPAELPDKAHRMAVQEMADAAAEEEEEEEEARAEEEAVAEGEARAQAQAEAMDEAEADADARIVEEAEAVIMSESEGLPITEDFVDLREGA
eukprot:TRINITY_DN8319_c0_g1_i13.p1 TRINITY_DN8319_c0_g1~~TRINITY_DN8319_c0_g1_i13.p1  ORF type:complete len:420 (+),score=142.59 TRINITY_DN8319_c0_g1_i13:100-1359(+)